MQIINDAAEVMIIRFDILIDYVNSLFCEFKIASMGVSIYFVRISNILIYEAMVIFGAVVLY